VPDTDLSVGQFTPNNPVIKDNTQSSIIISTVTVRMPDGSTFNGTLQFTDASGRFTPDGTNSGSHVVTQRTITQSHDGSGPYTVTTNLGG
jgi:hypothetical protein